MNQQKWDKSCTDSVRVVRNTCEAAALPDRRVATTCCISSEKCCSNEIREKDGFKEEKIIISDRIAKFARKIIKSPPLSVDSLGHLLQQQDCLVHILWTHYRSSCKTQNQISARIVRGAFNPIKANVLFYVLAYSRVGIRRFEGNYLDTSKLTPIL